MSPNDSFKVSAQAPSAPFHLRSVLSTSSPLLLFNSYYLHCRIYDICCYSNDVSVLSVLRPLLSHFLISFSLLMATSIRSPLLCYLTSQFWSRRLHQLFSDIFFFFLSWTASARSLVLFTSPALCTLSVCGARVEEENFPQSFFMTMTVD